MPNSENSELDDILDGFDDSMSDIDSKAPANLSIHPSVQNQVEQNTLEEDKPYSITTFTTLGLSYNYKPHQSLSDGTDYHGLSKLQTSLNVNFESRLVNQWKTVINTAIFYDAMYAINGRNNYSDDVLDEYEYDFEFNEVFIQGSFNSHLDFKIGRQILVWGEADNIRVIDKFNPLDNREPGQVDIEELRLPVVMTKLDYYFDQWSLSGVIVHENRANKNPVYGNDFYPGNIPEPRVITSSQDEYGIALKGVFSGWDLSFYWASFFDDKTHLEYDINANLVLRQSHLELFSGAANIVLGSWLFKTELAYINGLEYFATHLAEQEFDRLDSLIGFEYHGIENTLIEVEIANRHVVNYEDKLNNIIDDVQKNELQVALLFQQSFNHDTLHFTFFSTYFGLRAEKGAIQRLSLEYDLNDKLSATIGLVNYNAGSNASFVNWSDNDRLFFKVKYYF